MSLYFLVYWFLLFTERFSYMKKESSQKVRLKHIPFVSILVPAYNEQNTIESTLKSLSQLNWPKDKLEVIIIDDGSQDKTSEITKNFFKKHPDFPGKIIRHKNMGKAASMNRGLKILKGEYFACLDADSFVHPNTLRRMIFWHQKNPNLAITTPVMKVANPKNWIQKFQRLEYMTGMFLTKLMAYVDCNYVAPGPFSVYKTHIVKKIGGFDKHSLVEDQEIAYRAQKYHYKIMQVPKAYVETVTPSNWASLRRQRNRWSKGSMLNIHKYRSLIFNRQYGDFGMFQLPLNVTAFVLAFVGLGLAVYYAVKPLLDTIQNWWLIGFDLMPYVKSFTLEMDPLSFQYPALFIMYLLLGLTVVFMFFSSRAQNEHVRRYGVLYIIPYFFIYFLMTAYVMVEVVIELLFKRRQKW